MADAYLKWKAQQNEAAKLSFNAARANYASAPMNYGVPDAASKYTPDMFYMSQLKPPNPYSFQPTPYQQMLDREAASNKQAKADQKAIEAAAIKYRAEEEARRAAAAAAAGKAEGGGRKLRRNHRISSRRTRSRTSRRSRSRSRTSRRGRCRR